MKPTSEKDMRLDVLVRHTGDLYVGQCLQFDICVQGSTQEELRERFLRTIAAYAVSEGKHGPALFELPQAPFRYWVQVARGKPMTKNDYPVYVPVKSDGAARRDVRANFLMVEAAA